MTKKHFEAIAELFRKASVKYRGCDVKQYHEYLIEDFADLLEQENERFDRDRFYEACGLDS